jgi:hypothetical protein
MIIRVHHKVAVAAMLLTLTATAHGQQRGVILGREVGPVQEREVERSSVNFSAPWRPSGGSGATRVVGTVIDIRMLAVPNATLQLRNLDTGAIEEVIKSSEEGEYAFDIEEPGVYIVEMVLVDGLTVAVSNAGSVARYETLNTVVQLPGRWEMGRVVMTQPATSYFGMSAQTTMTAQTLQLAVENEIKPANPGRPVSPL